VELADARYVLETTAVDRAPDQLRRRLAERLEESIDQQRAAFAEGDVARFIDLTLAFHRGFVEAGDNRVMLEMYSQLSDRHRFTLFTIRHRLLERCEEIIAEHEALTRHLRSGDAAAFADPLRGHIAEHASPSTPARDTGGSLELCAPGRRRSGRALLPVRGFQSNRDGRRLRSWSTDIWETADSRSPRSPTAIGSPTARRWRTTRPRSACMPHSKRSSRPSTPPMSTRTPWPKRSSAMPWPGSGANHSRSSPRSTFPPDRRATTTRGFRAST